MSTISGDQTEIDHLKRKITEIEKQTLDNENQIRHFEGENSKLKLDKERCEREMSEAQDKMQKDEREAEKLKKQYDKIM